MQENKPAYKITHDDGAELLLTEEQAKEIYLNSGCYYWDDMKDTLGRDPRPITCMGANFRTYLLERIADGEDN